MLSGLSFKSALVFSINSLILSGFPLISFHLAKANLAPRAILKNFKNLFFAFLLQRKDVQGSRLSWSLTIYFFVALYSCLCSCPKIAENAFFEKVFLVLILQSTCFIYIAWKRKQTMEQEPHRACEWTKSNKQTKKNKVT